MIQLWGVPVIVEIRAFRGPFGLESRSPASSPCWQSSTIVLSTDVFSCQRYGGLKLQTWNSYPTNWELSHEYIKLLVVSTLIKEGSKHKLEGKLQWRLSCSRMIDSSNQLMFILSSAVYSATDKPLTYTTRSRPSRLIHMSGIKYLRNDSQESIWINVSLMCNLFTTIADELYTVEPVHFKCKSALGELLPTSAWENF